MRVEYFKGEANQLLAWLYLFSVLAAAGLLFTMVFFVSLIKVLLVMVISKLLAINTSKLLTIDTSKSLVVHTNKNPDNHVQ